MIKLRDNIKQALAKGDVFGWFPILLLIFSLYLIYRVVEPFLNTVIIAIVIAGIFNPLYSWFEKRFKGRKLPAAIVVLLIIIFCFLIPAFLFVSGLISQGVDTIGDVNRWLRTTDVSSLLESGHMAPYMDWVKERFPFLDLSQLNLQSRLLELSQTVGQNAIRLGTLILGNVAGLTIHFAMMIFIVFYLLMDGKKMLKQLKYLLPLREDQSDAIATSLRKVSRAVLVGGLLVAVLQGIVGGIGLVIVGVPALFWGTMMGMASFVPILGTGMIWVPTACYLLLVGQWQEALFLALWMILVVVNIDTFLRPYFMKGAAGMPVFFIFLSVIGGVQAFGPAGLLYGPLILSFSMAMIRIYSEDYKDMLSQRPKANLANDNTYPPED